MADDPRVDPLTAAEHYVIRAAWQVLHDLGCPLARASDFIDRLEAQVLKWHVDDVESDSEVAA